MVVGHQKWKQIFKNNKNVLLWTLYIRGPRDVQGPFNSDLLITHLKIKINKCYDVLVYDRDNTCGYNVLLMEIKKKNGIDKQIIKLNNINWLTFKGNLIKYWNIPVFYHNMSKSIGCNYCL